MFFVFVDVKWSKEEALKLCEVVKNEVVDQVSFFHLLI